MTTFRPVSNQASFPEMEREILAVWRDRDIFGRSVSQREGGPVYTLYEGPPTANGTPGIHHVLARAFKDVMPRYKTMRGYYAPRKGGWDTHGLPVELEVERELGLHTKREIEAFGITEFNNRCRESVFRYVKQWEDLTDRIGFWIDLDTPYVTSANSYIESGWWIFKQLWDKGLVYRDYKVTPHCPRCVTSLSSHEVALGYRDDTPDPSVHVKLHVNDSERTRDVLPPLDLPTSFLAWTTTPWTLPANVALAVAGDARYVIVEGAFGMPGHRERLILAEALAETTLAEPFEIVAVVLGRDLEGVTYDPLFNFVQPDKPAHRVILGDFVTLSDGTGIVHIAPAYGADDLKAGRAEDLPIIHTVSPEGNVLDFPDVPYAGMHFKQADPLITEELVARGLLYRSGTIQHTYPFCWRCDSPLLYYAKESWYIRTTALKDELIRNNQEIGWHPEHIRDGRFGEWLQNNVDWAISRERYWGTPIPIWICSGC
ncbi:MAG: class I tRNA ligase family protein, partial [Chloroflexi bacterium]|nr:class I tRNA ligase family protein [Chloroflexota bacterium]